MRQKLLLGCGVLAALVLAFGFGLYFSWCWGLWGKGSLFMRYLFQCNCPAVSEKERYAPYTVLVSACNRPWLYDLSLDGRYALLARGNPSLDFNLYMIDLVSKSEKRLSVESGSVDFLDDNLLLVIQLNLNGGRQASVLNSLDDTHIAAEFIGDFYRTKSLDATHRQMIQNADRILEKGSYFVVLPTDLQSQTVLVIDVHRAPDARNALVQLLAELNVQHQTLPQTLPQMSLTSPDGKLYADVFGLYESGTGQHILETWQPIQWRQTAYNFAPQGWVNGGRAVVYGTGRYDYAFKTDVFGHYLPVPLPILLLEVPPEYWPTP